MTFIMKNEEENISTEDLRLANELLNELHSDEASRKSGNLLYEELFTFKNNLTHQYSEGANFAKNKCWDNIYADINNTRQSAPSKVHSNLFTLHKLRPYLKYAAIFLVTILFSILYLQSRDQEPSLIASSGSEITIVELSDGSMVTLRPNANLYRVEESGNEHTFRLEGEAYFSVSNQPERSFVVEAGNGFIEVLGTQFNIRTWQNSTTVYLDSGSLRLSSMNRENEIILQPGQVSTIQTDNQISDPIVTEKEYYTSWQQNIVIFNNRQALTIFRELEYHFSVQIEAPSEIENTLLGGAISLESLQTALLNLGVVLDGEFVLISDNRYRFEELN